MERPRALVAWSSGKDSAWALHVLRQQADLDVVGLLTTVTEDSGKVTMHRTSETVLDAQAEAIGLPLWKVFIPDPYPNDVYEQAMNAQVDRARSEGITVIAFGDLFLEDIRQYREVRLTGTGITPIFPLWRANTSTLASDMVKYGLRARIISIDTTRLDISFLGRAFDESFLKDLPPHVDPCGEKGEFHTIVHAGPMFGYPLCLSAGDIDQQGPFAYLDVHLTSEQTPTAV